MLSLYHTATIHLVSLNLTNLIADSAFFLLDTFHQRIFATGFGRIVFWKQTKMTLPAAKKHVTKSPTVRAQPSKPMFVLGPFLYHWTQRCHQIQMQPVLRRYEWWYIMIPSNYYPSPTNASSADLTLELITHRSPTFTQTLERIEMVKWIDTFV